MEASDGKKYQTDVADVETLLRLIQSVPSSKAEPIKLWLAKVGYERMQEMTDPERALNRSREYWQKLGRSEKWIQPKKHNIRVTSFHPGGMNTEFYDEMEGVPVESYMDPKKLQKFWYIFLR